MAGNRGPCPGHRTVHQRGHLGVLRHTEEALGIWRPEKSQENLGPQLRLLFVDKTKQFTSTQVQAQAPRLMVLEMWINLHSSAFCEGLLYWPGGQSTFLSLVTHLIWHDLCQTTQPFWVVDAVPRPWGYWLSQAFIYCQACQCFLLPVLTPTSEFPCPRLPFAYSLLLVICVAVLEFRGSYFFVFGPFFKLAGNRSALSPSVCQAVNDTF